MTEQYFLPFYGSFKMHDHGSVEWQPNLNLSRSADEQFKMNLERGHFDNKKLIGEYTIEENEDE